MSADYVHTQGVSENITKCKEYLTMYTRIYYNFMCGEGGEEESIIGKSPGGKEATES
jgi:hypothetical protein